MTSLVQPLCVLLSFCRSSAVITKLNLRRWSLQELIIHLFVNVNVFFSKAKTRTSTVTSKWTFVCLPSRQYSEFLCSQQVKTIIIKLIFLPKLTFMTETQKKQRENTDRMRSEDFCAELSQVRYQQQESLSHMWSHTHVCVYIMCLSSFLVMNFICSHDMEEIKNEWVDQPMRKNISILPHLN